MFAKSLDEAKECKTAVQFKQWRVNHIDSIMKLQFDFDEESKAQGSSTDREAENLKEASEKLSVAL